MDDSYSPRTSQKADVRPISFMLDSSGSLGTHVVLPIRPEDLTRSEPQRAAVHQTLGRGLQGWVDHFGEGLPSVTIAGHTGWGYKAATGKDGFESFEALNKLVVHDYPAARQAAIDGGRDPSKVKLIFSDQLDNFAWPVVPMQFNLRRSKSSPLLFRYNMVLQATATSIDGELSSFSPNLGSFSAGLGALGGALDRITSMITNVKNAVFGVIRSIAGTIMGFVNFAVGILRGVQGVIKSVTGFITGAAGLVVGIAKSISQVGREVFRTFSAIAGIGQAFKSAFSSISAAFNEIVCIFSNSLRPRKTYSDYDGLYGASGCSSTTGGRMPSGYAGSNVFSLITPQARAPLGMNAGAQASAGAVLSSDPVLAPLSTAAIGSHLNTIVSGTTAVAA